MAVPLWVRLNETERAEVERCYEAARDAETRTRCQMILLAADGKPAAQIGWLVRRSEDTVRRVVWRFLQQGVDGVPRRPPPGRPMAVPTAWQVELRRVIDLDPRTVGVPSAVWTTRLLSAYLERVTGHHAPSRRCGCICIGPATCASGQPGASSASPPNKLGG